MLPEDRLTVFYELTETIEKEKYIIDTQKKQLKDGDVSYHYVMKNDEDTTVSKLDCFVYDTINQMKFDWILMVNVKTISKYRRKGLSTKLIKQMCSDMKRYYPSKGIYLFVKEDNEGAKRLYQKLNFRLLKKYRLRDGMYNIMVKGRKDTSQLDNMNFS